MGKVPSIATATRRHSAHRLPIARPTTLDRPCRACPSSPATCPSALWPFDWGTNSLSRGWRLPFWACGRGPSAVCSCHPSKATALASTSARLRPRFPGNGRCRRTRPSRCCLKCSSCGPTLDPARGDGGSNTPARFATVPTSLRGLSETSTSSYERGVAGGRYGAQRTPYMAGREVVVCFVGRRAAGGDGRVRPCSSCPSPIAPCRETSTAMFASIWGRLPRARQGPAGAVDRRQSGRTSAALRAAAKTMATLQSPEGVVASKQLGLKTRDAIFLDGREEQASRLPGAVCHGHCGLRHPSSAAAAEPQPPPQPPPPPRSSTSPST